MGASILSNLDVEGELRQAREEGNRALEEYFDASKVHELHRGDRNLGDFREPGPPLSILDTKIQRNKNRRN